MAITTLLAALVALQWGYAPIIVIAVTRTACARQGEVILSKWNALWRRLQQDWPLFHSHGWMT
jgi:hypothetical protein